MSLLSDRSSAGFGGLSACEIGVGVALIFATIAVGTSSIYPPMTDVSSHIATAKIADRLLEGDEFFSAHYTIDLIPVPYWATTLLLLGFLQFMDPMAALDALVVLYFVAVPLAYYWALRVGAPTNVSLTLVAILLLFNAGYWRGTTNFLIGWPLIFACFALFLGLRKVRSLRFLFFCCTAVGVYLCHVFDLGALVVVIGSLAAIDLVGRRMRLPSIPRLGAVHWLAVGWVVVLFGAAAWLILFAHGTSANRGALVLSWSISRLIDTAAITFDTLVVDTRLGVLFSAALALLVVAPQLRSRIGGLWGKVNPAFLWPAIGLALLCYAGPWGIDNGDFGIEDIAPRFAPLAFLFALAAVKLPPSRYWRAAFVTAVALFGTVKVSDAWLVHSRHDQIAVELSRGLLAEIPEHSRVLPIFDLDQRTVDTTEAERPNTASRMDYIVHHFANYVVVERDSYNPHVFARTGQQPLRSVDWDEYRTFPRRDVSDEEWAYYDFLIVQTRFDSPRVPGLAEHGRLIGAAAGFRLYLLEK